MRWLPDELAPSLKEEMMQGRTTAVNNACKNCISEKIKENAHRCDERDDADGAKQTKAPRLQMLDP